MSSKKPQENRRRKWKIKSHYSERFPGEYSQDQMKALQDESERRGIGIISVIREAIDVRFNLRDGRRQNGGPGTD